MRKNQSNALFIISSIVFGGLFISFWGVLLKMGINYKNDISNNYQFYQLSLAFFLLGYIGFTFLIRNYRYKIRIGILAIATSLELILVFASFKNTGDPYDYYLLAMGLTLGSLIFSLTLLFIYKIRVGVRALSLGISILALIICGFTLAFGKVATGMYITSLVFAILSISFNILIVGLAYTTDKLIDKEVEEE